jgi:alkylation response protein AidB-like acyl-CoA dehydrogenase
VGPLQGPRPTVEGGTLVGDIPSLPDAAAATVILVLAESDSGTGLFTIDATAPALSMTERSHVDPTRKLFDVRFDGVPAHRVASAPADAIRGLVDDVLIAHAADAADPDERHLAAVRAKAFASQLAAVADTAIQVFGGIGYTWEHDAHLYLKRLLGWSAFLGGPDQYLQEVGRALR